MTEDNQVRRSSRSTKGRNTKLSYEEELENELKAKRKLPTVVKSPAAKKSKTNGKATEVIDKSTISANRTDKDENEEEDEDENEDEEQAEQPIDDSDDEFVGSDAENNHKDDDLEETVRCLVCGATDENYDEDNDKLGLMVECSKCKTWQHSKCLLGHKNPKKVPDDYTCNVCDPSRYSDLQLKLNLKDYQKNKAERRKPTIEKKLSFNKIRMSVAQTFHKLFLTLIPQHGGVENDEVDRVAQTLSIDLEQAIFNNYSATKSQKQAPGQKYSEKSRSLYSNLKDEKNILFKQILDKKLTMNELTLMSPQELLNPDLQKFSKQVMAQAIHDSVLKPLQKPTFKKTHKGDEAMEDEYNDVESTTNVGLLFKRNEEAKEESDSKEEHSEEESMTQPTDVEESQTTTSEEPSHRPSLINLNSPIDLDEGKNSPQREYEDVGLDDDLDNILNDKAESEYDPANPSSEEVHPEIWEGELTFPGLCNFQSKLTFLSTTNAHQSFDKELNSMKKIMDSFSIKSLLEIDGRLSVDKAVVYLSKILKSRYLNVCDLTFVDDESNYQRLFHYFHNKGKVGVIGNRPDFVKDCYLLTFDKQFIEDIKNSKIADQNMNTLFNSFKQNVFSNKEVKDTILLVFVIKPNFENDLNTSQALKKLPSNFYKLTSSNQQKFMEIIEASEKSGKKLNEHDIENLVKNLLT